MFTQLFIQTQMQENIKASRHWPVPVNSPHKGPVYAENVSIWWRHHVNWTLSVREVPLPRLDVRILTIKSSWYNELIRDDMMTSSNGNMCRVTGHLCGEFTGHRWIPRTKGQWCGASWICAWILNKSLSKQWWGWWFETASPPLWRHCNGLA